MKLDLPRKSLDDYDLGFVREHVLEKGILAREELDEVEREFKRFIQLTRVATGPLAVIDPRVDEFWHCFIRFTAQYEAFCSNMLGFFVHHQPRTSMTDVPMEAIPNFVSAYRGSYGELNEFWLEKVPADTRDDVRAGRVPSNFGLWSGWPGR